MRSELGGCRITLRYLGGLYMEHAEALGPPDLVVALNAGLVPWPRLEPGFSARLAPSNQEAPAFLKTRVRVAVVAVA